MASEVVGSSPIVHPIHSSQAVQRNQSTRFLTRKAGFLFVRHGGHPQPALRRRHPDQGKTIRIAQVSEDSEGVAGNGRGRLKEATGSERPIAQANLVRPYGKVSVQKSAMPDIPGCSVNFAVDCPCFPCVAWEPSWPAPQAVAIHAAGCTSDHTPVSMWHVGTRKRATVRLRNMLNSDWNCKLCCGF